MDSTTTDNPPAEPSSGKKYLCLYYWVILPLRGGITDNPERTPAFSSYFKSKEGQEYIVSVFCDDAGDPHFIRCNIPGLEEKNIPSDCLPFLQLLKEHLLSVLRLTYKLDLLLFSRSIWTFREEGEEPSTSVLIEEHGRDHFNSELTRNVFVQSINDREIIRLYADGVNEFLPIPFRYLSFYKIIENKFRSSGFWDKDGLDELLEKYSHLFENHELVGKPTAIIHGLRDACAHAKTGSKREAWGITHLNYKELAKAEKGIKILTAICIDLINELGQGKYGITPKSD